MPALLIFAATVDGLNGYDRGDIVAILPADASPGAAVEANNPIRFGFVYITGVSHDNAALQALVSPYRDGEGADDEILSKSQWQVPVVSIGIEAATYREFNDPLAIKFTATALQNAVARKARADAVAHRIAVLTQRRDAIQARIDQLNNE